MLVVLPEAKYEADPDRLEAVALGLLGVDLTRQKSTLRQAGDIVLAAVRATSFGGSLPAMTRHERILESREFLRELMSKLYLTDRATLLPNLLVLPAGDGRLSQFTFSDSMPELGVVYSVHPASPTRYIRSADFHSYLVQDKRAEFLRLVSALGAKSVRVAESDLNERQIGLEGRVDTAPIGAKVSVSHSKEQTFTASLTNEDVPRLLPRRPSDLAWIHREPLWQAMAETRERDGVTSFAVEFSYTEDFGVNAALAAKLESFGLSIGGTFQTVRAIRHRYDIEFHPLSAYRSDVASGGDNPKQSLQLE